MNRQRLNIIIVTAAVFLVATAATALFVYEINRQAALLEERVIAHQTDQAQQSQLVRLKKLFIETTTERETLEAQYLQSQSDSIDFLNYVETMARTEGVALRTLNAKEISQENTTYLQVSYTLTGSRPLLESFLNLLETVPFVSELTSVRLVRQSDSEWRADVTITVVILDTHETT